MGERESMLVCLRQTRLPRQLRPAIPGFRVTLIDNDRRMLFTVVHGGDFQPYSLVNEDIRSEARPWLD
jgi:hypothetical protein